MELDNKSKEKIKSSTPRYTIQLTRTDGSKILLTLWEKRNDENNTIDSDRLWAKTDDGEGIFVVRYFDVDPILKKRSYFFRQ